MAAATWILTGSPENCAGTRELGFSVKAFAGDHWTLAFQGRLPTISEGDARVLVEAMERRAGVGV
jgi:hypothetical protein